MDKDKSILEKFTETMKGFADSASEALKADRSPKADDPRRPYALRSRRFCRRPHACRSWRGPARRKRHAAKKTAKRSAAKTVKRAASKKFARKAAKKRPIQDGGIRKEGGSRLCEERGLSRAPPAIISLTHQLIFKPTTSLARLSTGLRLRLGPRGVLSGNPSA